MELPATDIQVAWARPSDARADHLDLCNPDERARYARYRRAADAARFLAGCALVRIMAGAYLGRTPAAVEINRRCPDCGRPHSCPRVEGLEVSVSHSGSRVVVAMARERAVGVDVERIPSILDVAEIAPRVLTPVERTMIPRAADFARLWVRKEAVLKAVGVGLRINPSTVDVIGDTVQIAGVAVTVVDLDSASGYVAAVAGIGPPRRVATASGVHI